MISSLICASAKHAAWSPSVQHIAENSSDSWLFIAFYCNCRVNAIVKLKMKKRMKKFQCDRKTLRRSIVTHFRRKMFQNL